MRGAAWDGRRRSPEISRIESRRLATQSLYPMSDSEYGIMEYLFDVGSC